MALSLRVERHHVGLVLQLAVTVCPHAGSWEVPLMMLIWQDQWNDRSRLGRRMMYLAPLYALSTLPTPSWWMVCILYVAC